MKLVRKIKFNRAKEMAVFKKLEIMFKKLIISNNPKHIKSVNDFSKLNFFVVLEYINLINEKIDYNKIFPDNILGNNSIIDFNNLIEEQEKLKSYIQKNQRKTPSFFKNLGLLNEVVGCYMVVTTHKHLKKVKNFDFSKKDSKEFIVSKFDLNKLPSEFETLCLNYSKNKSNFIDRELEEFQNFLNLSNEEQDELIDEMLTDLQFPNIEMGDNNFEFIPQHSSTANTIQFAVENNIDQIYNSEFLMCLLSSAEESENYELCVKIRDRIKAIKK